mmetsp:Transcript_67751/g.176292  ORF Transcript_67751/g.176292 Transcript_67751/m.176292 type:complete len:220 (+) Transcript_67751:466-1125(+)
MLPFHHLEHLGLATRRRRRIAPVKPGVVAVFVEEYLIGVDLVLWNVQFKRQGVEHILEAARDEVDIGTLLVEHLHNLPYARRPCRKPCLPFDALVEASFGHAMVGHQLQTIIHRVLKLHVAVHGLVGELRDFLHDPEAVAHLVNALCLQYRAVHVEEHGICLQEQLLRALDRLGGARRGAPRGRQRAQAGQDDQRTQHHKRPRLSSAGDLGGHLAEPDL